MHINRQVYIDKTDIIEDKKQGLYHVKQLQLLQQDQSQSDERFNYLHPTQQHSYIDLIESASNTDSQEVISVNSKMPANSQQRIVGEYKSQVKFSDEISNCYIKSESLDYTPLDSNIEIALPINTQITAINPSAKQLHQYNNQETINSLYGKNFSNGRQQITQHKTTNSQQSNMLNPTIKQLPTESNGQQAQQQLIELSSNQPYYNNRPINEQNYPITYKVESPPLSETDCQITRCRSGCLCVSVDTYFTDLWKFTSKEIKQMEKTIEQIRYNPFSSDLSIRDYLAWISTIKPRLQTYSIAKATYVLTYAINTDYIHRAIKQFQYILPTLGLKELIYQYGKALYIHMEIDPSEEATKLSLYKDRIVSNRNLYQRAVDLLFCWPKQTHPADLCYKILLTIAGYLRIPQQKHLFQKIQQIYPSIIDYQKYGELIGEVTANGLQPKTDFPVNYLDCQNFAKWIIDEAVREHIPLQYTGYNKSIRKVIMQRRTRNNNNGQRNNRGETDLFTDQQTSYCNKQRYHNKNRYKSSNKDCYNNNQYSNKIRQSRFLRRKQQQVINPVQRFRKTQQNQYNKYKQMPTINQCTEHPDKPHTNAECWDQHPDLLPIHFRKKRRIYGRQ